MLVMQTIPPIFEDDLLKLEKLLCCVYGFSVNALRTEKK